jgi:tripartite-type tricarboxylate transporter receptor subunit TctC
MSAPSAHTVNAVLFKSLPYDPIRDFAPVAGLASTPLFLAVHPSLPVRSVKELVALAKRNPVRSPMHRRATAPRAISRASFSRA